MSIERFNVYGQLLEDNDPDIGAHFVRYSAYRALAAELAACRARLAEAERDAERYRWLRDGRDYEVICEQPGNLYLKMPRELDAAIDAARAAGSAEEVQK
jgi:hypothetical protein